MTFLFLFGCTQTIFKLTKSKTFLIYVLKFSQYVYTRGCGQRNDL